MINFLEKYNQIVRNCVIQIDEVLTRHDNVSTVTLLDLI